MRGAPPLEPRSPSSDRGSLRRPDFGRGEASRICGRTEGCNGAELSRAAVVRERRPEHVASGIGLRACGAAADFEVLEKLRRLAFAKDVDEPKQLELWKGEVVAAGA